MDWLDYTIRPEQLYIDFHREDTSIPEKHPKYQQACKLLQNLASLKNLGSLILREQNSETKAEFQQDEKDSDTLYINNSERSYDFGPSTPKSPGPCDDDYLLENETLDNKSSFDFQDSPKFQFSMFSRDLKTGLPTKYITEILDINNSLSNHKNKSFRILNLICELIRLVRISELEIEENVHSSARHLIFNYLLESTSQNFDPTAISKKIGFRLAPNNSNTCNKKFYEFLYHKWIVRSFYREKSMVFDIFKSTALNALTDTIDPSYKNLLELLQDKEFSDSYLNEFDTASSYYDLGRYKFMISEFEQSLSMFEISVLNNPKFSKVSNKSLSRLQGESGRVFDYIVSCEKIISQSSNRFTSDKDIEVIDARNLATLKETSLPMDLKATAGHFFNIYDNNENCILDSQNIFSSEYIDNNQNAFIIPDDIDSYTSLDGIIKNNINGFLSGIFMNNKHDITEISIINSIFAQGLNLLEQENYFDAYSFFRCASEYKNSDVLKFSSSINSINPSSSPEIDNLKAQSKSYMHLAKALHLTCYSSDYQPNSENTTLSSEILNQTKLAFNGTNEDSGPKPAKNIIISLDFSYLERLTLASMRLGNQELFVYIVERVILNPTQYQQNPDINVPLLNISSGLFLLKNLLSQFKLLDFNFDSYELNTSCLYSKQLKESIPVALVSDIRSHYLRILHSFLSLTSSEDYSFDFETFFSWINDPTIWVMLSGMISGTVYSILPKNSSTRWCHLDSYGILSLFTLDDSILKSELGVFKRLSPLESFINNNIMNEYKKSNLFSDENSDEKNSKVENKISDENIKISQKTTINCFCPNFLPSILSSCDIIWLCKSLDLNFYGNMTQTHENSLSNENPKNFKNQKRTFGELNSITYSKKSSGQVDRNFDGKIDSLGHVFPILEPKFDHNKSFALGFLEYVYIITEGFKPLYLYIILSYSNNVSSVFPNIDKPQTVTDLNGSAGDINNKKLYQLSTKFLKEKEVEISFSRDRLNNFIDILKSENLHICVSSLLQFPRKQPKVSKLDFSPHKISYQVIFYHIDSAISQNQINEETSLFLWDFLVCQYANFSLKKYKKNEKAKILEKSPNTANSGNDSSSNRNFIGLINPKQHPNDIIGVNSIKNESLEIPKSFKPKTCIDDYYNLNKNSPLKAIELSQIYNTSEIEGTDTSFDFGNEEILTRFNTKNSNFDYFEYQQRISSDEIFDFKLHSVESLFTWIMLHYKCK
ncbi:hypothetical protein AYI70_g5899 [Smittium culicis]|uniref:Uncharacterized protein n=1 Tax=Smittium culicis TaxID=133412 RepID=A0A1R1XFM5_9FUNG|nr:hypothetical protein AYI70_g8501 [Smittium culicis]OMJ17562.1 hypothetical protein AYI70_g5899 [Smittium culicis]